MNRLLLSLALSVFFLSGCSYPIVENPLVAPDECRSCADLHGAFVTVNPKNKKPGYLHIGSAGKSYPAGFLKVIVVHQPDNEDRPLNATAFVAFAEPVSDSHIVHIPLPTDCDLDQQLDRLDHQWDIKKIEHYLLLRLAKTESGFVLYLLDEEFIAGQIESSDLAGRIEQEFDEASPPPGGRTARVTAGTRELREYFDSTPLEKLFEDQGIHYDKLK